MKNKNLITWIASYPRSGNTWVRAFLTAYFNQGEVNINSIMQTGDKESVYYGPILDTPISERSMEDQAMIKPAAMMRMLEAAGDNIILKTHDANVDIAGVPQIPSHVTRAAIYLARDPRDVALSLMNHYKLSSLDTAIDQMLQQDFMTRFPDKGLIVPQLSWKMNIGSWFQKTNFPLFTLRYEDLISQPFDKFSEIVHFLKIDYDANLVKKCMAATQFDKLQSQEKKTGFREGVGATFFHKGQVQRWKTDMDKSHQVRIEKACADEMKALGYL